MRKPVLILLFLLIPSLARAKHLMKPYLKYMTIVPVFNVGESGTTNDIHVKFIFKSQTEFSSKTDFIIETENTHVKK